MNILKFTITVISSFIGMELVSWFIHKYIMHGPLWKIHKSHHEHTQAPIELNDVFTMFFGGIAIWLIVWGLETAHLTMAAAGVGISLYGCTYFVLHDLFIHRRLKVFRRSRNRFLNALAEAHRDHHKSRKKEKGTSFGLLLVNLKYFKKHINRKEIKS